MFSCFVILMLLFATSESVKVAFKDCGSAEGTVSYVDIDPCDNPARCALKRGTTPTVSINFAPKEDSVTQVTAKVTGIIGPIKYPFKLDNPNGCKDSGLSCPLTKDQNYTYHQGIHVKNTYPSIGVTVRWELVDQNDHDITCITVETHVDGSSESAEYLYDDEVEM